MSRALRYVVILVLLGSCTPNVSERVVLDRDERVRVRCAIQDGRKHGPITLYRPDGRVRAKGTYTRDLRSGWWRFYHANGAVACLGRFETGQPEGIHVQWLPDGRIYRAEGFEHGVFHGAVVRFHADGTPQEWAHYVHGAQDGEQHQWFQEEGRTVSSVHGTCMQGHREGLWTDLDGEGRVRYQRIFKHGQRVQVIYPQQRK